MPIGPLMIDLESTKITKEEIELLQHPLVGGVILFSRNFEDIDTLRQLVYSIRNACKTPLLIAIDQEGGRVQRLKDGFTQLPPNRLLGQLYDKDREKALKFANSIGWLMASEMLVLGIDISFAPVLDIDTGLSSIIKGRGFHEDPDSISFLAEAYINGMNNAGMSATGKHFPGHGNVKEDSHLQLPHDNRSMQEISDLDIIPFSDLATRLDAIMPAHIVYDEVDELPACFSEIWLKEILRTEFCFNGAIISDDLSMKATECMGDYNTRARYALSAGCDMVLVCNNRKGVHEVLSASEIPVNPKSQQRLLKLCGHFQMTQEELVRLPEWNEARYCIEQLLEVEQK